MQGDVGIFPFMQLARPSELSPGGQNGLKGVPDFVGLSDQSMRFEDSDYVLRRWHGHGVVIDVTSELANSPDDARVTVAALAPKDRANVNWDAAANGLLAGTIALPQADRGSISAGFPVSDWPDMVLSPRSVTTISRQIAMEGRLMTLTPRMAGVLSAKLAELYGARQWARIKHLDNVLNQVLVAVDDIDKNEPAPSKGRWAILSFGNHERVQVFLNPKP